jgi:hypothetical protein
MAERFAIGSFGSLGDRLMTSGSPGSTTMTTTPAAATKKSSNKTMEGVSAPPLLMPNTVAATNSITSASSWVIWYRMYDMTLA